MPLPSGTRLGPYQISTVLGVGGMGEVYRAHDSRLHRDVAGELSFLSVVNRLMSVRVTVSAGKLNAGSPGPLFSINPRTPALQTTPTSDRNYAPLGDGFLVNDKEVDPRAQQWSTFW